MTNPVILLGTQSNGETLPVQVDATGRLVAEGLQGEKGDKGDPGEKGDKGDPGEPGADASLPGGASEGDVLGWENGQAQWVDLTGLPEPYGEPGSVLLIDENGNPVWGNITPPEPTLPGIYAIDGITGDPKGFGMRTETGALIEPADGWDAYAQTLSNWSLTPDETKIMGISSDQKFGLTQQYRVIEGLGKVLNITMYVNMENKSPYSNPWILTVELNNSNSQVISNTVEIPRGGTGMYYATFTASFLLTRDDYPDLGVSATITSSQKLETMHHFCFCHWYLENPGEYMARTKLLMEIEEAQQSEPVTTTDIDLLRQSQD